MKRILLLCCLIFLTLPTFCLEEVFSLGNDDNWKDITVFDNTRITEGRGGFSDIALKHGEYEDTADTDIVLHFNSPADLFTLSGYRLLEANTAYSEEYRELGTGAVAFRHETDSLVFSTGRNTVFSPDYTGGDFSIEFRLYPARLSEGEKILAWEGSTVRNGMVYPQKIECGITGRKILWRMDNFFRSPDGDFLSLELRGKSTLLPRQWDHHLLRYDAETGLLEYVLNGSPEAVIHTTTSGREESLIYTPAPGSSEEGMLRIAGSFIGMMDELRISRSFIERPFLDTYRRETGTAMTRIFDLDFSNSRLLRITSRRRTPANTSVRYFYRVSDSPIGNNTLPGPWIEFLPGQNLSNGPRGRFVQVMMELFPDGTGEFSPSVSDLTLYYEPDLPPLPTSRLSAVAGDRNITLTWRPVVENDVAGYLVYYGFEPGNYFGTGLPAGDSPLNATNSVSLTLEGLENGKLYYFSVVTYDSSEPPHYSAFSEEISVRPSAVHGSTP